MTRARLQDGFCVSFRTSPAGIGASFQLLQVSAYVSRVLITLVSIFVECLVDDLFQHRRDIGTDASRGNRGPRQNGLDNYSARAAAKRLAPCRHFIQQKAEREDIRARVQIVS